MRLNFIFGLLGFFLIVLSILLYIKEDVSLEIITCPTIHSYFKTSETETFEIEILSNQPQNYRFDKEYISSSVIRSLDESIVVPISITDISWSDSGYIYQGNSYQHVQFSLKIAFDSPDFEIHIPEAYLNLHYSNNEAILIKIGEFHYRFLKMQANDLVVGSMQSTVMKLSEVSTVNGIALELSNNARENIVIQSINIGSNLVTANNFYLTEIETLPDLFDLPGNIIGIPNYDYLDEQLSYQKNYLLRENNMSYLYVPFQYPSSLLWLQRFYLIVTYEVSGETRELIIDDFPYIRTNLFQQGKESEYMHYVFQN